jgi:hypothetical protein
VKAEGRMNKDTKARNSLTCCRGYKEFGVAGAKPVLWGSGRAVETETGMKAPASFRSHLSPS